MSQGTEHLGTRIVLVTTTAFWYTYQTSTVPPGGVQREARHDPSEFMKKTTEATQQPTIRKPRAASKTPKSAPDGEIEQAPKAATRKAATKEAPAEPARGNLRAQGLRTRNEIVRVARKLLLEAGSLDFTLREVALHAGISISNLQYYFPTRLSVLRAVVEPVIDVYLEDLSRAMDNGAPPREKLVALVERAFRDSKNAERSALWWHFVSLAATDLESSRLLDEWYETVTRGVAQLIRSVNPRSSVADSLHLATLLIAMADGLSFQLGAGRRKRDYTRGLEAKFLAVVDFFLQGDAPPFRSA